MKLELYTVAILLCIQLSQTDAWTRSRSRSRAKSKSKTTVDVDVHADNKGSKVSGGVKHENDKWKGGISGSADSKGNWEVKAGVSVEIGKRSVDWRSKQYTVTLSVDQCNFNVYDINRDGYITIDEIKMIFGEDKGSENLFNDLNMTTDDDVIDQKEFTAMAPLLIKGCDNSFLLDGAL